MIARARAVCADHGCETCNAGNDDCWTAWALRDFAASEIEEDRKRFMKPPEDGWPGYYNEVYAASGAGTGITLTADQVREWANDYGPGHGPTGGDDGD